MKTQFNFKMYKISSFQLLLYYPLTKIWACIGSVPGKQRKIDLPVYMHKMRAKLMTKGKTHDSAFTKEFICIKLLLVFVF